MRSLHSCALLPTVAKHVYIYICQTLNKQELPKYTAMCDDNHVQKVIVKGVCHPPSNIDNPRPINLFEHDFDDAKQQIKQGIPALFEHVEQIGKCVDAEVTSDGLEISMEIDASLNPKAAELCEDLKAGKATWCMSLSHSYKRDDSQDKVASVSASADPSSSLMKTIRLDDPGVRWQMHMKEVSIVKVPGREGCVIKSAIPMNGDEGIVCASGNLISVDIDGYKCIPEEGIVQRSSTSACIMLETDMAKNEPLTTQKNDGHDSENMISDATQSKTNVLDAGTVEPLSAEDVPTQMGVANVEEDPKEKFPNQTEPDQQPVQDLKTDEQTLEVLQTAMHEIKMLRQTLLKKDEEITQHEQATASHAKSQLNSAVQSLQKELGKNITLASTSNTEKNVDNETGYVRMNLKDLENITTALGSRKVDRVKSQLTSDMESEHAHSLNTKRTANQAGLQDEKSPKESKVGVPKAISNQQKMYQNFSNQEIDHINRSAANVRNGKMSTQDYNKVVFDMAQQILEQGGGAVAANQSSFGSINHVGQLNLTSAMGYNMKHQNPMLFNEIVQAANSNTSSRLYASLLY